MALVNSFRKVTVADSTAVTLILSASAGEDYGAVMLPAIENAGAWEVLISKDDLSANEAFAFAVEKANELRAELVVEDPQGIWRREWGTLFEEPENEKRAPPKERPEPSV